jgi:Ca2+-binding RTX toxin-like protein
LTSNPATVDFSVASVSNIESLIGSAGNDVVTFSITQLAQFTSGINLGIGTDTLNINGTTGTYAPASDGALSGVEIISAAAMTGNVIINLSNQTEAFTITGGAGNDTLTGGSGADTLTGGAGNDLLVGGAGNDTYIFASLAGGLGNDVISGDTGSDDNTIVFQSYTTFATLNFNDSSTAATSDLIITYDGGQITYAGMLGSGNIQFINFGGATYASYALGTSNYSIQSDLSGAGVIASSSAGETLTGDASANLLFGNGGNDTLIGDAGNDLMVGGVGNDNLQGGADNDVYAFALTDGTDTITEGGGTADRIAIIANGAALSSLDFTDSSTSTTSGDLVISYNGQQITVSSHFAGGNNVVEQLTFIGGAGFDGYSLTDTYTISTDDSGSRDGGAGNDIVAGDANANTITGGAGNDLLFGAGGNDTLTGGAGNDYIDGGAGTDTAVFSGNRSAYTVTGSGTGPFTLTGPDGTDVVNGVEFFQFADGTVSAAGLTDTTPPTISAVAITSNAGADNTYATGDVIQVTVTFSEAVTVTGAPQLTLTVGGASCTANYTSGSGTSALVFSYTVQAGDVDADGIGIPANAISLNGGTIRDAGLNNAVLTSSALADQANHLVDGVAPTAVATVTALSADSGVSATDFITNVAAQTVSGTFTGTLEAGEKIQVSTNGTTWIDAIADANTGTFTANVTLPVGSGTLSVRTVDDIGNALAGTGRGFTLDQTAPVISGLSVTDSAITFTATDGASPLSLVGPFASIFNPSVTSGTPKTVNPAAQSSPVSGTLQVQDAAGNVANVIGLALGTTGADNLTSPTGTSNVLYGFDGNDTLIGTGTNDTFIGGAGADHIISNFNASVVLLASGDFAPGEIIDIEAASSGSGIRLTGAQTVDFTTGTIIGFAGSLSLLGSSGSDNVTLGGEIPLIRPDQLLPFFTIDLGGGTDTLTIKLNLTSNWSAWSSDAAITGVESLIVDATAASGITINSAQSENTTVIGSAGNDTITTGSGADNITGGAGDDVINAGNGANTVDGGSGNDTITTGTGADTLIGGAGNDTLSGGSGNDTYRFSVNDGADTINEGGGTDAIQIISGGAALTTLAASDSNTATARSLSL